MGLEQTPEQKKHEEVVLENSGQPTTSETERGRTTGETPEQQLHQEEAKKPQKARQNQGAPQGHNGSAGGAHRRHPTMNSAVLKTKAKNAGKTLLGATDKTLKKMPGGRLGVIAAAVAAPVAVGEFQKTAQEEGLVSATGKAALVGAAATAIHPALLISGYGAIKTGEAVYGVGKTLYQRSLEYARAGTASPFAANRFVETKDTFSMRQAAMAAIGQARGNLDNYMMGNEAGMFHR